MKHGLHNDGRKCGPIDPSRVNESGWSWYDTEQERDAAIPSPSLSEVENGCCADIDIKASEVRGRFISSGTGQSAVYLTKYEEARAYQAADNPSDDDYPYLDAEANRRGLSVSDLSDEVIVTRDAWTSPAGATIEAERVGGKADVRKATTADDKRTAADNAIAVLDGIKP